MKISLKITSLLLAALLTPALADDSTHDYTLEWSGFYAGGTSVGEEFTLTGTIGQPDAGTLTGGGFTLTGGIQALLAAVPAPGAPVLCFDRTATNTVVLSWANTPEGWLLERAPALDPTASWTAVPQPWQTNATSVYVIEPLSAGSQFYRLRQP